MATAAFGDPGHPDVAMLRRLREEMLVHSAAARAFIRTCWRIGPRLARTIRAGALTQGRPRVHADAARPHGEGRRAAFRAAKARGGLCPHRLADGPRDIWTKARGRSGQ
ncbi:hypothetical protein [Paracoccus bogoriensis]|uniref:hypothetical protein n=1 Tax=Paracoccus bogoriensis TaxID=242065 RepID=UPI003CCE97CC